MKYSIVFGFVTLIALITAGCDLNQDISGTDSGLQSQPQEVQDFVHLLNEYREDQGLNQLEWHDNVAAAALFHSEDMRDRDYFSHNDPDGGTPWDRLENHGVSYSGAAENIAAGYRTGEAVLQGWLNSSGHKANIDNASYTHHGVGFVEGSNLWTHKFVSDPR